MEEKRKDLEVLWTPKQVAAYFTVSMQTVYGWIREKKTLDPTKIMRIGSRVRIPRSEVERVAGTMRNKIINQQ